MAAFDLIIHFKRVFGDAEAHQIISRLNRFPLVWESLHRETFFHRVETGLDNNPKLWNPVNICAIAGGYDAALGIKKDNEKKIASYSAPENINQLVEININSIDTNNAFTFAQNLYKKRDSHEWSEIVDNLCLEKITIQDAFEKWGLVLTILLYLSDFDAEFIQQLITRSENTNISILTAYLIETVLNEQSEKTKVLETLLLRQPVENFTEIMQGLNYFQNSTLASSLSKKYLKANPYCDTKEEYSKTSTINSSLNCIRLLKNFSYLYKISCQKERSLELSRRSRDILRDIAGQLKLFDLDQSIDTSNIESNQLEINNRAYGKIISDLIKKINSTAVIRKNNPLEAKGLARQIYRELHNIRNLHSEIYSPDTGFLIEPVSLVNFFLQMDMVVEANQLSHQLIRNFPADEELLRVAAKMAFRYGDHQTSLEIYLLLEAIEELSRNEKLSLIESLEYLGHWESAFTTREKINITEKDDLIGYAICSYRAGKFGDFIEFCEQNHKEFISHSLYKILRVLHLLNSGMDKSAEVKVQEIVEADPVDDLCVQFISDYYCIIKDKIKGKTFLEKYFINNPVNPEINLQLVKMYIEKADKNSAVDLLIKTAESGRFINQKTVEEISAKLIVFGKTDIAQDFINRMSGVWPLSPTILSLKGQLLLERKKFEESQKIFSSLIDRKDIEPQWVINYCLSILGCTQSNFPLDVDRKNIEKNATLFWKLIKRLEFSSNINVLKMMEIEFSATNKISRYEDLLKKKENLSESDGWNLKAGLGKAYFDSAKFDLAIINLKEAYISNPQNLELIKYLAKAYTKLHLWDEAINLIVQRVDFSELPFEWLIEIQQEFIGLGKWEQFLNNLIRTDPDNTFYQFALFMYLCASSEKQRALDYLQNINIQNNMNNPYYLMFSQALIQIGENSKAERLVEVYLSNEKYLKPENCLSCAFIYETLGKPEKAIKTLKLINKQEVSVAVYTAHLYRESGKYIKALTEIKSAVEIYGEGAPELSISVQPGIIKSKFYENVVNNSETILLEAIEIGLISKDLSFAVKAAEIGMVNCSESIEILRYYVELANLLLDENRINRAINYIEELKEAEFPVDLICLMGEIALRRGEEILAANYLSDGLRKNGHSPRLLALQARIITKNGNYKEGLKIYQKSKETTTFCQEPDTEMQRNATHLYNILWMAEAAFDFDEHNYVLDICKKEIERFGIVDQANRVFLKSLAMILEKNILLENLSVRDNLINTSDDDFQLLSEIENQIIKSDHKKPEILNLTIHCKALISTKSEDFINASELLVCDENLLTILYTSYNLHGLNAAEIILNGYPLRDDAKLLLAVIAKGKNPKNSMRLLSGINEHSSFNAEFYAALAFIEKNLGNMDEAYAAINLALQEWPNEHEWEKFAGQLSLELGNMKDAITHFEKANSTSEIYTNFENLEKLYIEANSIHAIDGLEKKLAENPDDVDLLLTIGKLLFENKRFNKAAYYIKKAVEIAPERIDPVLILCEIALEMGNIRFAENRINSILEIHPSDQKVLCLKAKLISMDVGAQAAIKYIEPFIEFEGAEKTLLIIMKSKFLVQENGFETALDFLQSIKDSQKTAEIHYEISRLYLELGEFRKATSEAEQALATYGENDRILAIIGKSARGLGDLDRAIGFLIKAIQSNPFQPEYYLDLSNTYSIRKEINKAVETLDQGLKLIPGSLDLLISSGLLFYKMGLYEKAKIKLFLAKKVDPKNPEIQNLLNLLDSASAVEKSIRSDTNSFLYAEEVLQ